MRISDWSSDVCASDLALIAGREIGKNGIRAIGEDYKELEARQVIKVRERSPGRYTMRLLKKDVGELALTIVRGGGGGAEEALLLDGSPASRSEEHTSELQSLMRISYAVFCLKK